MTAVARLTCSLLLCLTGFVLAGPALAIDRVSLSIGDIEGEGWHAEGLDLRLPLRGGEAEVRVKRVQLPGDTQLTDLRLRCGDLGLTPTTLRCDGATLSTTLPWLGKVEGAGELTMKLDGSRVEGQWQLTTDVGTAEFAVHSDDGGWTVDVAELTITEPGALLADWLPADHGVEGWLALEGRLRADDGRTRAWLEWQSELTAHDAEGRLASEGLALDGRLLALRHGAGPWALRTTLRSDRGQAYAEPIFLDLDDHPLHLTAGADWHPETGQLDVRQFNLNQQGQGELSGQALLNGLELQTARVRLRNGRAGGLYSVYAHPWLVGSNLDQLTLQGRLDGALEWRDGAPHAARLQAHGVQLDDADQRFALRDFSGLVNWAAADAEAPADSRVQWREARLMQLPLGEARLGFSARGRDVRLQPRQVLPILSGGLRVNQLQVAQIGTDDLDILFEADILPIDLGELTRELGWPPLSGILSGNLPEMTYRDGHLNLGGTLIAQVFDGLLRVDDLSLEDPFGPAPVFRADLRMRSWDLDHFTQVLQVGRIEGLVHADVLGLHMIGWEPVAFDARAWSPERTRERRRISQRAVEDIAQIGGSTPADWISRQFLRVFDAFRYRRLGMSCRLEQGICHMDGVAPANGGYYLIEGRSIPRINVIGFAREVSWPALRQQIHQAVQQDDGPMVE